MGKFTVGNGQYVIYAKDSEQARQVIGQELQRVDKIREKMANLLSKDGIAMQNFMENTSEENLNIYFNDETSLIYDDPENATTKGEVRQRNIENNKLTYDLAYRYPDIQGHNADFRLAHEMGHLMLNPSNASHQKYDEKSNSRQVAGLIRRNEETGKYYGEQIQENAINLLAQLAIRENVKADDIITGKVDLSEFNSYKKCDDLVKLLAVSMRNDFDKEISFEQLAEQKIDAIITREDGSQVPANTFFYGILNDSSIIENEFDKYLGDGAWRDLNQAFEQLYDHNISKEKFDLVFKNAQGLIQEFANVRYLDKHKEAVTRNGGFNNIPNLTEKLEMIEKMTGRQFGRNEDTIPQQEDVRMPEGYSINEFGEIIRPAREEHQTQVQSQSQTQGKEESIRTSRFGTAINSNSYSQHLQPIAQRVDNKLTLKQKIAQFLQKNNLFMNMSFVENFVHKQLDILPEPTQDIRESNTTMPINRTREHFIDQLTNFGEYRNLPPIQRMSDPEKIAQMRRKMEQNQQSNDDLEK